MARPLQPKYPSAAAGPASIPSRTSRDKQDAHALRAALHRLHGHEGDFADAMLALFEGYLVMRLDRDRQPRAVLHDSESGLFYVGLPHAPGQPGTTFRPEALDTDDMGAIDWCVVGRPGKGAARWR